MNMQITELNPEQIRQVYAERLTADFPPAEVKPLKRIMQAMSAGKYRCTGLFDGNRLLAYGFFVILRGTDRTDLLLDYFAVDASHRGQGIGSSFLRMLPEQFPAAGTVLIEAETPASAENEAERMQRERRIRFYLRSGCQDSGIETTVFGVGYRILTLPLHAVLSPEQLPCCYAALYRQILPEDMFRAQIRIPGISSGSGKA